MSDVQPPFPEEEDGDPSPSATPSSEEGVLSLPATIIVPAEAAGMRLDTWLARLPGAPSRNRVQQLVKDGHVLVDGEGAKRSHEINGGERVDITWPPLDDAWPYPENIPLDIVFEDDQIIVVNKQHGLIVHPSAGNPDGTLVNGLLFHCQGQLPGINGVRRPGIVHRLDRDTTGLLVVAKTDRAMTSLANQLSARTMKRTYIATIIGDPNWDEITVDAAIGRDPINRLKRAIDGPFAKSARSHFRVLRRAHRFALIECRLETGRTHQIRIHCKHIGHPIVCDDTYDGQLQRCVERLGNGFPELRRLFARYNRPWLHARQLEFTHPGTQKSMRFTVPPPEDSRTLAVELFGPEAVPFFGERGAVEVIHAKPADQNPEG